MVDEFAGPPQITSMSVDPLSFVNVITNTEIEIEFSEPLQSHHDSRSHGSRKNQIPKCSLVLPSVQALHQDPLQEVTTSG